MTKLKLSECIRLGAMLKPQAFGQLFGGKDGGSCAVGAAAEALGIQADHTSCVGVPTIYDHSWPADLQWMFSTDPPPCPECGNVRASVDALVRHLNDTHRWTRERIADLVQTIEEAQPVADEGVREPSQSAMASAARTALVSAAR